jgi:hypothetical protein
MKARVLVLLKCLLIHKVLSALIGEIKTKLLSRVLTPLKRIN